MAKKVIVQPEPEQTGDFESTPALRLIVAWAVVGVPLIYGVSQVFIKSLALFQ